MTCLKLLGVCILSDMPLYLRVIEKASQNAALILSIEIDNELSSVQVCTSCREALCVTRVVSARGVFLLMSGL